MSGFRNALYLLVPLVTCTMAAAALGAQDAPRPPRCTDTLPPSQLHRDVAYLEFSRPEGVSPRMAAQIANFVQSMADHAQRLLGGDGSSLPPAEPVLRWFDVFGSVVVTAHRDGTYAASPIPAGADTAGQKFLVRAVDAVRADGEPFLWPADEHDESISFVVAYHVSPMTTIGPIRVRVPLPAVAVFSVATPTVAPVETVPGQERHPSYPEIALGAGASGFLLVQFVVDERGRAAPATIKLVEVPGARHDVFERSFFDAVRTALLSSRYRPAHVGDCPVRQVVQQEFDFGINDRPLSPVH